MIIITEGRKTFTFIRKANTGTVRPGPKKKHKTLISQIKAQLQQNSLQVKCYESIQRSQPEGCIDDCIPFVLSAFAWNCSISDYIYENGEHS